MRQNSTLGSNSLDIEALVNLWISYWHFASVTRYLSGTEFGTLRRRWDDAVAGQPAFLDKAALNGSR
jgi:hypothetical protein